jgi:uncharacterized membrane protein YbhN (UPF0104 family)
VRPAAVQVLAWTVAGAGVAVLAAGVVSVRPSAGLVIAGAFSLSWLIGFLTVPVPAGLGVREVVFVLLTRPVLDGTLALSFAISARLVTTLLEVVLAVVAAVEAHRTRSREKSSSGS